MNRLAALCCIVLTLVACGPPKAREGTLDSENPAAKLYAIRKAGESGDRAAVPKLVESLENDDPAVRMMTINALERLTGERLGYNPYAPLHERHEAVERWQRAVDEGRFGGATTRPADTR
jgi:hypothetical protein